MPYGFTGLRVFVLNQALIDSMFTGHFTGCTGLIKRGVYMVGSCEQTTEYLLMQWGLWQIYSVGRASSPMAAVMQVAGGVSRGLEIHINDDEGLAVDRAVAALKARDRDLYAMVDFKFIKRYPNKMIEDVLRLDRRVVERRLAGAICWVDSYLNNSQYCATLATAKIF